MRLNRSKLMLTEVGHDRILTRPRSRQPPPNSATTGRHRLYADKAYVGAGGAIGTPYKRKKRRKLGKRKKLFNRYHAKVRALGEQGAATLEGRHICGRPAAHPAA
jgi:hypothetical protein